MSTVPTTTAKRVSEMTDAEIDAEIRASTSQPSDYARGLADGQVLVLEQVLADMDHFEDPKRLIRALLEHWRQRAAELNVAAGR